MKVLYLIGLDHVILAATVHFYHFIEMQISTDGMKRA